MNEDNTQNNQNSNGTGINIGEDLKTIQLQKQEEELKQYTQENIKNIINAVMKNTNNKYREIKYVHASGHGGQKINHGNSKAQLHFNIDNFYKDFDIKDKTRDDFVKIV
jgi:protein subunit release factor B